jgi:hypothetical protein
VAGSSQIINPHIIARLERLNCSKNWGEIKAEISRHIMSVCTLISEPKPPTDNPPDLRKFYAE